MRSFLIIILLTITTASQVLSQNVLASEEFEAENVSTVTLRGSFCDVYVETGDKVYFKGIIEGKGREGDYEILSDLDGDQLEIRVQSRRGARWGWNWNAQSKLELKIPANTELFIDNSSGDVYVDGISGDRIRLNTSSGDIEASGISGELDVECTSGDIELRDIRANVAVATTSGDIDIQDVEGEISCLATSGDIQLESFVGGTEIRTTSGEIKVKRGKGEMTFRSTSGNIDGYDLELTADLLVRASSGDIEIVLVNDISNLNFELESSSGDLDVGRRSGERDLYIKEGDEFFWVKGLTSSGDMDFRN